MKTGCSSIAKMVNILARFKKMCMNLIDTDYDKNIKSKPSNCSNSGPLKRSYEYDYRLYSSVKMERKKIYDCTVEDTISI